MTQYQTDQVQQLVSDHNSEIAHVSNFRRLVACGVAAMMSLGIAGVESPDASAATITDRIAGADRYGTAEAIADQAYPDTAGTVFLATGEKYADALAAGPVAAKEGAPLLITASNKLSGSTANLLKRLHPTELVVVGGSSAVSESVVEEAQQDAGQPNLTRIAGANRYSTVTELARRAFTGPNDKIYVASGEGFADALSGAAAAASQGNVVVLTPPDSLPSDVADIIRQYDPNQIEILGGSQAISSNVETKLKAIAPINRLAGPDRYGTSVAVAKFAFGVAPQTAYLATGEGFADALVGSMLPAKNHEPLVLSKRVCLPDSSREYLGNASLTVLGGTNAISNDVTSECEVPLTPVRIVERNVPNPDYLCPSYVIPAQGAAILLSLACHARPGLAFQIQRLRGDGSLQQAIDIPDQPYQLAETADGSVWYSKNDNSIGRVLGGRITSLNTSGQVRDMENAPDGSVWFGTGDKLGQITSQGSIKEFDAPGSPIDIVVALDGKVWYGDNRNGKAFIVSRSTDGTYSEVAVVPPAGQQNNGIDSIFLGPNGKVWFTQWGGRVSYVDGSAIVNAFAVPSSITGDFPTMTGLSGPDGNIWLSSTGSRNGQFIHQIVRSTPYGTFQNFAMQNGSQDLTIGSDNNIWFTEPNVDKIDTIYFN